jgi:glycosyltransferase involved in cell wall biosynthesis
LKGGKRIKILQVSKYYYPSIGGIQEHVRNISEKLSHSNDVTVCATDPSGNLLREETINRVKIKRFKSSFPIEAYQFSPELHRYLTKHSGDFDIVHAHGYHAIVALYAASAKSTNKLVFTSHYHGKGHTAFATLLHIPYKRYGRRIFEKSDIVICVSNYEKKMIQKNFKIDNEKIIVIPNGLNRSEFSGLKKAKKNSHKIILYVGRLEKYKGIHFIIEALPKLDETFNLEIVGPGSYREKLSELSTRLNVAHRVKFFQGLSRAEVLQKYIDADVVVQLSRCEAYALTVAEALTAGTPCLVANCQALTEWVDGKNCFGVNYPIDIEKLSDLINSTSSKQVKAASVYTKISDWTEIAGRLENLYRSLI